MIKRGLSHFYLYICLSIILILFSPKIKINCQVDNEKSPFLSDTSYSYTLPSDKNWPTSDDFNLLKSSIPNKVFLIGDPGYNPYTINTRNKTPQPAAIIYPTSTDDIKSAFNFAKKYNIRISVQSTGHHQDLRNINDNSIHINFKNMKNKEIDINNKTITASTGNTFKDLHYYIKDKTDGKLILLGGSAISVGPYGWTVGGGHGVFTRMYGLGVDNVINFEVLTANGLVINANKDENSDLFRALRGSGGPAYGIVISMKMKLHENPGKITVKGGIYPSTQETIDMNNKLMSSGKNYLHSYMIMLNTLTDSPYILMAIRCIGNDSDNCVKELDNYFPKGCLMSCETNVYDDYYDFIKTAPKEDNQGAYYLYSTFVPIDKLIEAGKAVLNFINNNEETSCYNNGVLGGASSDMDKDGNETSVNPIMRKSVIALTCVKWFSQYISSEEKKQKIKVLHDWGENTLKKISNAVYWNEPNHDYPENDWKERYWGSMENYNKLLEVKKKYDPLNVFTCYHCVGYDMLVSKREISPEPAVCPKVDCSCTNNSDGDCSYYGSSGYKKVIVWVMVMVVLVII